MKMSKKDDCLDWLNRVIATEKSTAGLPSIVPNAKYALEIIKALEDSNSLTPFACWYCAGQMIWGGDHSFEDYGIEVDEETGEGDGVVTNLRCANCGAEAFFRTAPDEGHHAPDIY
tara:strand:+ start:9326 stop:9673 length:348 start_codon:yes stop_codon:yes gene_type:complete